MLHLQNLSENGNNSVHGMTTLNSAKEDKANEEFFQNVTTNQKHLNKLYDVETYTFEQMKSILEETANSVNEKTEEIISLNNEKLKKFDELSDESTSENEEIFVMEDIEVKNNRKVIIPKLQLGRIKKISDPVISTDDDSLFDGSSTDCQNTTDDDLEDLLGTPLKLRNSADEDLNNKSEEISHSESRWLIFHELLQTERSYVQTLQILMEMYIVPSKSCLSVSAFNSIFGEIEMILGVNKTFLEKLEEFEEIKSQEEKELKLSDLLKNYFITFKLYVKYISNYNSAQVHLRNSILKNSKFHRFLQTVRTELISKKYRMQTLNSYLISPIQRLPRYELLCKDLVYHSTKDTQLHQNLSQALQLIQYVAKYCNEKSGEIEADLRMRFLKKYLKIKVNEEISFYILGFDFESQKNNQRIKNEENQEKWKRSIM
eukprot:gene9755-2082_t